MCLQLNSRAIYSNPLTKAEDGTYIVTLSQDSWSGTNDEEASLVFNLQKGAPVTSMEWSGVVTSLPLSVHAYQLAGFLPIIQK